MGDLIPSHRGEYGSPVVSLGKTYSQKETSTRLKCDNGVAVMEVGRRGPNGRAAAYCVLL